MRNRRSKSMNDLIEKKFRTYRFDGIWDRAFGEQETNGAWLIWGREKNGKTWFALMLAEYLSKYAKAMYISGEEGTGPLFVASCKRAGIRKNNRKLRFCEYMPVDELDELLKQRAAPRIVLIDNLTIYDEELKYGRFRQLLTTHKNTLFIFIAHEENKQPYTGSAKMCRRLAKVIVHVEGLAASVGGRCPGGVISIHKEKAQLYWGTETENNNSDE